MRFGYVLFYIKIRGLVNTDVHKTPTFSIEPFFAHLMQDGYSIKERAYSALYFFYFSLAACFITDDVKALTNK